MTTPGYRAKQELAALLQGKAAAQREKQENKRKLLTIVFLIFAKL